MMKRIQILGMGCIKCKKLTTLCQQVLEEMNLDLPIEKVDNMTEILNFGVVSTPALVIDGKIIFSGKIPSIKILRNFFEEANKKI